MSSTARQQSGIVTAPNRGTRCRAVRATPSCDHCHGPVCLNEAEVARLGAELRLEVTCPGCGRAFTLSLTPPVAPDLECPAGPSGALPAGTAAPPRKARPPFRPLLGAAPTGPVGEGGAKVAPFAPLPSDDTHLPGDPVTPRPRGKESLNRWWKRLSARQQKTVLAAAACVVVVAALV